jgi:hypothetical protein
LNSFASSPQKINKRTLYPDKLIFLLFQIAIQQKHFCEC